MDHRQASLQAVAKQLHAAIHAGEPAVVAGLEARGAARVAAMRAAQPPRRLRRAVALVLRAAHRQLEEFDPS